MLHEFKLEYNMVKGERKNELRTLTRGFDEFCISHKNVNN